MLPISELSEVDLLASDCFNQLDDILGKSFPDPMPSSSLSTLDDWASLFRRSVDGDAEPFEDCLTTGTLSSSVANTEGLLPSQLLDSFASSLEIQSPPEKASDQGRLSDK